MLTVTGSITINAGASLELNGEDVTIHGNLTIDGTFAPGNGTVTLENTYPDYAHIIEMIKRLVND